MEKTARKPSMDPVQERLRQNKALWNKEVSSFINDLIHFKKTMNGWPSKFFKERSRITQPVPADPATIIGSLAGDFQELVNKGNSVIQEQLEYSKNRRQKQPKAPAAPQQPGAPATPPTAPTPEAPKPDLAQQLGKGLAASPQRAELIKLAAEFEDKYSLESQASNPLTRFVARLFNPKFGFGEAARMRRLRMTTLDACAKTFKVLKSLQAEIVKSSESSIESSHKMMTMAWNNWNIVYRLISAFKALKPGDVKEPGGIIEDPESKRQRAIEEGHDPGETAEPPAVASQVNTALVSKLRDFRGAATFLGSSISNPQFKNMVSLVERLSAIPKGRNLSITEVTELEKAYDEALAATAQEAGFSNMSSFAQIAQTLITAANSPKKEAQEFRGFLGKTRHQLLPGGTSGSRLEIYSLIEQAKKDVDELMDLLEAGYERDKIEKSVAQINRQMSALRTMIRSLFYSVKPEKASSPFF